jgi:hypothetical protein
MSTVHVPPVAGTAVVPQLSAVTVKFVVSERVGAPHPVAFAPPELVRVNVWVAEFVATGIPAKSKESGVHASDGATPVTVIIFAVVETVPPFVQVRESVAVWAPVDAGFARMLARQLPDATRLFVPQEFATSVKFVVSERAGTAQPVASVFPELEKVKSWVAVLAFVATDPNANVSGATARTIFVPFSLRWEVAVWLSPEVDVHVTERFAWRTPVVDGVPATPSVQEAPLAKVPQFDETRWKFSASLRTGAVHVTEPPDWPATSSFVIVSVEVAEVVWAGRSPKSSAVWSIVNVEKPTAE